MIMNHFTLPVNHMNNTFYIYSLLSLNGRVKLNSFWKTFLRYLYFIDLLISSCDKLRCIDNDVWKTLHLHLQKEQQAILLCHKCTMINDLCVLFCTVIMPRIFSLFWPFYYPIPIKWQFLSFYRIIKEPKNFQLLKNYRWQI